MSITIPYLATFYSSRITICKNSLTSKKACLRCPPGFSSPQRYCVAINKRVLPSTQDGRSGDEALERKPFINRLLAPRGPDGFHYIEGRLPTPLNDPHSKAEEPECLDRVCRRPFMSATESRGRRAATLPTSPFRSNRSCSPSRGHSWKSFGRELTN